MEIRRKERRLRVGRRRRRLLLHFFQPLTALQIAKRSGVDIDNCGHGIQEHTREGVLHCLSPNVRQSRVYWLTRAGQRLQWSLRQDEGLGFREHDFPVVDWHLYAWVCYRHRSAVLKAIGEPMQPATIRRKACRADPKLRMSAMNTRDVMRSFRRVGIVLPVKVRRYAHPRYVLSEQGKAMQHLLKRVDDPWSHDQWRAR